MTSPIPYTPPAQIERRKPRSVFDMDQQQVERFRMLADIYAKSSFSSGTGYDDVFVIMLKGIEVGLEPMAAMDLIHVIQGKPTISPQGMLALINATGEVEDIVIKSGEKSCTVTMKRKGRTSHSETFTWQNAADMQLTGKSNWKKQPAVMLKWRAISACARVVFPDVIQGMYTPEELAPDTSMDFEGNVTQFPQQAPAIEAPKPAPVVVDGTSAVKADPEPELENYDLVKVRNATDLEGNPLRFVSSEGEVFNVYLEGIALLEDMGWPTSKWRKQAYSEETNGFLLDVTAEVKPDPYNEKHEMLVIHKANNQPEADETPADEDDPTVNAPEPPPGSPFTRPAHPENDANTGKA